MQITTAISAIILESNASTMLDRQLRWGMNGYVYDYKIKISFDEMQKSV